ncbi:MAG: nuclear transport factor 2 family protein [Bacteroides sp.]|nr:nuclear transport factor 2 family protein [Bacteroides sp.]
MEKQTIPETVALRFNDCINRRDLDGLTDLMTDDHVFVDSIGQRVEGKRANRKMWNDFFTLFPDYQNIFETVTRQGNTVIMRGRSTCTDERLNTHSIWIAQVRGNQLEEWCVCSDTNEV